MCRPTVNILNPRLDDYMNVMAELHRRRNVMSPSADTPDQRQQPTRRVRFSSLVDEISPPGPLSKEDIKDLCWYSPKDLVTFKIQARQSIILCCSTKNHGNNNTNTRTNQPTTLNREDMDTLRGLEGCTLERRLQKHRSIQCTLSAIKRGMTAEEIAQVYKLCTAWNVEIALDQARHDYANAYQPHLAALIPRKSNIPPKFPFELKRVAGDCTKNDDDGDKKQHGNNNYPRFPRRVRRRIF